MQYYEDISGGDAYEYGSTTVSRDEIISFAETYDPQPFHVDEEYAQRSMFGGIIASGLHTLSVCNRLATDGAFENLAILGGYGIDSLRFCEPVAPGDTLSVRVEIQRKHGLDEQRGRGDVDIQITGCEMDGTEKISWVALTMMASKAHPAHQEVP